MKRDSDDDHSSSLEISDTEMYINVLNFRIILLFTLIELQRQLGYILVAQT